MPALTEAAVCFSTDRLACGDRSMKAISPTEKMITPIMMTSINSISVKPGRFLYLVETIGFF